MTQPAATQPAAVMVADVTQPAAVMVAEVTQPAAVMVATVRQPADVMHRAAVIVAEVRPGRWWQALV